LEPKVSHKIVKLGACPRCRAPGAEYEYTIQGPVDESRETVEISVRVKCSLCGYMDEKKILFPVKALYLIELLLVPELRPIVEKLYLLYKIRLAEAAQSGEDARSDDVEA